MLTPPPSPPPPPPPLQQPPLIFPATQKYNPGWPLIGFPANIAGWGARVGTRKWIAAAAASDFGTMAAVFAPAVLDAVIERTRAARDLKEAEFMRDYHLPIEQGTSTQRTFQGWLNLTNGYILDCHAAALDCLPPRYQAEVPELARVGAFCRAVLNKLWCPIVDSMYHSADHNKKRPVPLEELGMCDPMREENLGLVRGWVMLARGLATPPEPALKPPQHTVEEVDEDEWEEKMADLRAKGLIRD